MGKEEEKLKEQIQKLKDAKTLAEVTKASTELREQIRNIKETQKKEG